MQWSSLLLSTCCGNYGAEGIKEVFFNIYLFIYWDFILFYFMFLLIFFKNYLFSLLLWIRWAPATCHLLLVLYKNPQLLFFFKTKIPNYFVLQINLLLLTITKIWPITQKNFRNENCFYFLGPQRLSNITNMHIFPTSKNN